MDKYELKERLGVGSFGVVYKAFVISLFSINNSNNQ